MIMQIIITELSSLQLVLIIFITNDNYLHSMHFLNFFFIILFKLF